METIVKYSLNPLAAAFVPSSMKVSSGSITNNEFRHTRYEKAVELFGSKKVIVPVVRKRPNVTGFFRTTKAALTNVVHETTVARIFGATKETLADVVQEAIVTEESFATTKRAYSVVRETFRGMIGETTSGKLNGDEISDERSKVRTGTKDMSLKELDVFLPKKRFTKKAFKIEILINEAKFINTTLLWITRAVETDSCCRVKTDEVSLYLTKLYSSSYCSETKLDSNQITYPCNVEKAEVTDAEENGDECKCPPMFGWVVPLDFFGNPLKLTDTCSKKFIHTSYVDGSKKHGESEYFTEEDDESSDIYDEEITLEQCSSELKSIVKDVCDSVDRTLSLSCDQGSEEPNQVSTTSKKPPVWNTPTEAERSKLKTIDDGSHPLLQETPFVDTDDTDVSSIQEFLGAALSSFKDHSEPAVLHPSSACIPPCSIWCNNVPPPAKDTYKRFIKKLDPQSTSHHNSTGVNKKMFRKPLYKRCFSADDTPRSSDFDKVQLQSVSRCESRERLLLLRKDPVAFIKNSSSVGFNDSSRKQRSAKFSVVSEQVSANDHLSENILDRGHVAWSPYDSADSMWQPLPDCIPLSDHAQKNSHRRARDMRRQRSVC